ncbi:MAG: TlpA family protein disulfide reductase, partial [Gammaproteobacteria bacterium]|nr:TlpA family protein disulfide reductase [Gammaproteobacteria bacterium]
LPMSNAIAAGKPNVGLVDMEGNNTNIDAYTGNGKWLVVMLWSVTCGICAREVPVYSEFHDEHKSKDIRILGVSLDGFEKRNHIRDTMRQWDMRFPTLVADHGLFPANYEAATGERLVGTPTFMVYTPEGELVANNPGPMRTSALVDYITKRQARN